MRIPLLFLALLLSAAGAPAQQVLQTFAWAERTGSNAVVGGVVTQAGDRTALRVVNTNASPLHVQLLRIEKPPTESRAYAVRGEVKYSAVEGDGFLEMWSEFPPVREGLAPGRYFSRTLGISGPMGKLSRTSDWRKFELPFDPTGATGAPTQLEINLHLPGRGTVLVGPLTLVRYSTTSLSDLRQGATGGWWAERTSGILGGIVGTVVGCFSGLLAMLAARGRARGFVIYSITALTVLGALSLAAGILALLFRQPLHVWVLPALTGAILVTTLPARARQLRRRYAELELRRMTAEDVV